MRISIMIIWYPAFQKSGSNINFIPATFLFQALSYNKNIMKRNFLAVSIACTCLFIACSKNTSLKDGEVLIRVKNTTTENLINLKTLDKDFGSINVGAVTDYQGFQNVMDYPNASFVTTSGDSVYAVLYYFPMGPYPYLESGKYTLEIFDDTTTYSNYNARYLKE